MRSIFTFLVIILSFLSSYGQSDTIVVRDLKLDWKGVDAQGNLSNINLKGSEIIIFQLPQGTTELLRIASDESVDFWINNQLVNHDFKGTKIFSLDQLREKYGALERLSIYKKGGIGSVKTELIRVVQQNVLWNPLPRESLAKDDAFLLQILILVFLAAIFYWRDSEIFKGYLSLLRLRKSVLDDVTDLYNQSSLLKIIFLSFLVGTVMSYVGLYVSVRDNSSTTDFLLSWSWNVVFVFALVILKQMYTVLLSKAYGFQRAAILQLNGYSNLLILSFVPCLALLLVDFSVSHPDNNVLQTTVLIIVAVATLVMQVWTFLKLDNQYSGKKLMIFTYLCTSEMAPGFLVLYWLDKIG